MHRTPGLPVFSFEAGFTSLVDSGRKPYFGMAEQVAARDVS